MKMISIKCPSCRGNLKGKKMTKTIMGDIVEYHCKECSSCGERILLWSEAERIENDLLGNQRRRESEWEI